MVSELLNGERQRERESAGAGGCRSGGQMDSKRWSGALQHARGQSNKWAQLKTNTCLLTSPLCWLVKAGGTVFVLALSPSPPPSLPANPRPSLGGKLGPRCFW